MLHRRGLVVSFPPANGSWDRIPLGYRVDSFFEKIISALPAEAVHTYVHIIKMANSSPPATETDS
jgi:hypothetical protein